ncbi:MAG TPA: MaoC/PaaZ C-terminal domain-containing protein [Thermoleophilaceae bacterium]|nr:MaoC/PaaZ C-terminal domain-containing protein [Thermoleophilaceae bacterium]
MAVYLKAAVGALPGAGRLPFVAGGGGPMPDIELAEPEVRAERDRVAAYAQVCGFRLRDELPPTYPHVLAFPLHMRLMTDGSFPFAPVGLVHIANRIEVRRPLRLGEPLDVRVRPRAGDERTFALLSEIWADGELAWAEESTMLRPGGGSGPREADDPETAFVAEWQLPADLGRRYAAVSGDRNPIHMHRLAAKAFGFPRAIAHGMWTKARCLAALEPSLPEAYEVSVRFRKPVLLPSRVCFERAGERFRVRGGDRVHLSGQIRE